MAYPSNRALIACSVLALASAIVTLYYWQQLRKRRKSSSPSTTPSDNACGEQQQQNVVVEEEEGDSQILNSLLLASASAATALTQTQVTDCLDGTICVEKKSATITTTAPSVSSNHSCPSETKSEASEMANEIEVHRDDCRADSICESDSNSNPLVVDSALEGDTTAGAPELLTKTKEPETNDGNDSSSIKATDTVASVSDCVTVAVENHTPADASLSAGATSAGVDVVTEAKSATVDEVNKVTKSQTALTSLPSSAAVPEAAGEPEKSATSAGTSTTTSADSSAAPATSIRVAPAANSRKIITSNPVNRSITFAQVLSKKSTPAVPTDKQAKKMAKSSGPKPVDPSAPANNPNNKKSGGACKSASTGTSASAPSKPVISYAAVVQESSSSSSNSSPSSSPGNSTTRTTNSRTNKTPTPTPNTTTISSSISKQDSEVVDAYRNYPDTSATASLSSSSVEGQCSPNSDLGEFTCDVRSLGSNDSGTGSSELLHADTTITNGGDNHSQQSSPASAYHSIVNNNNSTNPADDQQLMCYQFELPIQLCGKLIGSSGHHINFVKQQSGTKIIVGPHYVLMSSHKICSITGTKAGVNIALGMIRKRFSIQEHPEVTLAPLPNPNIQILPQSCQLQLAPDHCVNDVILACTINAGHFFLQQPTHPTYPQLNQLDYLMKLHYSEGSAPPLPDIYPGLLCAAPTEEGWYRAMVKFVNQSKTQCDIMFVDYGGYAFNVPVSALRPIRSDFVVLPFQASECFLSNVAPVNPEKGWSTEANQFFVDQAKGQIIHAAIDSFDENNIPFVTLFKSQGANRTVINVELVEKGYAQWTEATSNKLNGKN